jgi:hypothetical protein
MKNDTLAWLSSFRWSFGWWLGQFRWSIGWWFIQFRWIFGRRLSRHLVGGFLKAVKTF